MFYSNFVRFSTHFTINEKNINEENILAKIKTYVRPSSFGPDSSLHQLLETKDFFEVIQNQIFDFVDSPRVFTMVTDILIHPTFCVEAKRKAFEIMSKFIIMQRQNKKTELFMTAEIFDKIGLHSRENSWKKEIWIDFAELYGEHPNVIDLLENQPIIDLR